MSSNERLTATTKNFWEFYLANRNFIDTLIEKRAKYLAPNLDAQDIRQDILMRMDDNDILKRFDPAKSSLNTYFTTNVNGYIRHYIDTTKQPVWRPYPYGQSFPDGEQHRYTQIYNSEVNGLPDDEDSYSVQLTSKEDIEETVSFREDLGKIYAALNKCPNDKLWKIFQLLDNGWSMVDIANEFSVGFEAIRCRREKLKAILRQLIDNAGILRKIKNPRTRAKAATFKVQEPKKVAPVIIADEDKPRLISRKRLLGYV